MTTRPRTIAALAAAMSLGTTAVGVGTATAATPSTTVSATRPSLSPENAGALVVARDAPRRAGNWSVRVTDRGTTLGVHTISDGAFRIARTLVSKAGKRHVVFIATNLRTGERCVLNGVT
jgi:hypothetical protein